MKWIDAFERPKPKGRKTRIWSIKPKGADVVIGEVRWHAPWRRYAFFPAKGSLYESDCLRGLSLFCLEKTEERKLERRQKGVSKVSNIPQRELKNALLSALGLGDMEIISADIRLRVEEPVSVSVTRYVTKLPEGFKGSWSQKHGELIKLAETYEVRRKE